ncbi:g6644 [Coccomyxa viridis]|uniref:G6644 protein n=1 Tax=Coccomyxa viridis TaxID=1274662 RepID=A0ABP1FY76_9CHLO
MGTNVRSLGDALALILKRRASQRSVHNSSCSSGLLAQETGLNRRQEVASVRALSEVMQDVAHVISKVEKLLAEIFTTDDSGTMSRPESAGGKPLEARVQIFERLATAVARLSFYTACGKELYYRQEFCAFGKQLQQQLSPRVLDVLATAICEELGSLLHGIDHGQIGLQLFDFLGNAVLAEVDTRLAAAMPGAVSVGVPIRFVANYKASQWFLERLEALSSTTRALKAFRGSIAYQSWLDRWKLYVYYGLCFQNVASALETGLSSKQRAREAAQACVT